MTAAVRTHFQATFTAATEEIAGVRRLVTDHLRSWGHTEAVEGAVLATNELFANAVQHGSVSEEDTVTVTIDCERNHFRIAVADSSPHLPFVRAVDTFAERGRGLAIVQEISDRWGAEATKDGGKQVWFTCAL